LEHGSELFGIPDVTEVAQDRSAAAAFFFGGELVVVNANGMADIAELVKEATFSVAPK